MEIFRSPACLSNAAVASGSFVLDESSFLATD